MNQKRILVTGGTGYIGSHTVVELQQSGFEVSIIDNLSNSNIAVVDQIEKISGIRPNFSKLDLLNKKGLFDYFENKETFDCVIHFAAFKPLLAYRIVGGCPGV